MHFGVWQYIKLDMLTARRRLKSPWLLSGKSTQSTMVTQKSIPWSWMVDSTLSFHVNWPPYSSDKACSISDLETSRSKSWVWPNGYIIGPVSYSFASFSFHNNQTNNPWDTVISIIWHWKRTRSWVGSNVKVIFYTQYPTDALPFCFSMHFLFVSHQSE